MNLEQILETFTINDGDTLVAVPSGYLILGFNDFEACRLPLIDVFDKVCVRMAEEIRFYTTHSMNRYRKVDGTFVELFRGWFADPYREPDGGGEYGVEAHSGSDPQGTGSWGLKFNVEPWNLEYEAGVLALKVPLQQAFDGTLEAVAREVAEALPLRSACAGLTISRNAGYPTNHDQTIAAWCMRYHGLIFDSPVGARFALHDGVLTPAWITILDASLAEACGSTESLADAGVQVEKIGELALLKAGDAPIIGDAHGDRSELAPYQALHAYLESVLFTEVEHLDFEGFDEEMLERWIARFGEA